MLSTMQMIEILGAGALLGIAGLMALAGAMSAHAGDAEGGCFGRVMALLTGGAGLVILVLALK